MVIKAAEPVLCMVLQLFVIGLQLEGQGSLNSKCHT